MTSFFAGMFQLKNNFQKILIALSQGTRVMLLRGFSKKNLRCSYAKSSIYDLAAYCSIQNLIKHLTDRLLQACTLTSEFLFLYVGSVSHVPMKPHHTRRVQTALIHELWLEGIHVDRLHF